MKLINNIVEALLLLICIPIVAFVTAIELFKVVSKESK